MMLKKEQYKRWLVLLLIAVLLLGMTACGQDSDEDKVTLWAFTELHYSVEGKDILAYENRYDDQGRLIYNMNCMKTCFSDDPLFTKTTYTYNEQGDCVRQDVDSTLYGSKFEALRYTTNEYTYVYNENGQKTEKYRVTEEGKQLEESYLYENGLLSQVNRDGFVNTYVYENGKLVKILSGEENDVTPSYRAFDSEGRITEIANYGEETAACYAVDRFSYDEAGRVILLQRGDMADPSGEFDRLGKQLEIRYDENGNPKECADLLYDDTEPLQYRTDGNGNIVGFTNVQGVFGTAVFKYTPIRVTRDQARKLLTENTYYCNCIGSAYTAIQGMPVMYRLEG